MTKVSLSPTRFTEKQAGIDAFWDPGSEAVDHVSLAVPGLVAAHVGPWGCARCPSLSGAPPRWTPVPGLAYTWVPARPLGSHPDVTLSFHIRPRPRAARRAGASVAEPVPRCCAPQAAHRALPVWLSPTLLARELPTRGVGPGSTAPRTHGLLRSRERSRRPHPTWGGEPGGWGKPRG